MHLTKRDKQRLKKEEGAGLNWRLFYVLIENLCFLLKAKQVFNHQKDNDQTGNNSHHQDDVLVKMLFSVFRLCFLLYLFVFHFLSFKINYTSILFSEVISSPEDNYSIHK